MPSDLITDELLNAIAMQESRNRPTAIGDKKLKNKAYGAYQLRLPAFTDVQRDYPQYRGINLPDILGNAILQRELTRAYLNVLHDRYGMQTLDQLIGAYNKGAGNIKKGVYPTDYIRKVRGYME